MIMINQIQGFPWTRGCRRPQEIVIKAWSVAEVYHPACRLRTHSTWQPRFSDISDAKTRRKVCSPGRGWQITPWHEQYPKKIQQHMLLLLAAQLYESNG